MADNDEDDLTDPFEETSKPKKLHYPKCYIDKKHDRDPICKECAMDLYGTLPKTKYKYPRNCWNCQELGTLPDEDFDSDEPYYEDLSD